MSVEEVGCPYCGRAAVLVGGLVIYAFRQDLRHKRFWYCGPCGAWVGCHPAADAEGRGGVGDGTVPLGRLANAELRALKRQAHAVFDPLWRSGHMKRKNAYAWLASQLGIESADCHIGWMNATDCQRVIDICARETERLMESGMWLVPAEKTTNCVGNGREMRL